VGTVQDDERMLRFVNSVDAPRLAALGTVVSGSLSAHEDQPLFLQWDPETGDAGALLESLPAALDAYRKE